MTAARFPDGFLWGVATSAAQIEGGAEEGGRGESIWDRFASRPGTIADGSDPRTACDHFHRWREDVRHLEGLGVGAYRFSVAWPRVLPRGTGKANEPGLAFYDALVDALLAAGIRPLVTLYHWDLPQALQERGGWGSRETVKAFADYAALVGARLGDRVHHWVTHNEPWCVATLGHEEGHHAPGHRDPAEALRVAHHLLVSHGLAGEALRATAPAAEIGIVLNLTPATPASGSEEDREAARWFDGMFNRWYLDPIFTGRYPEDAVADRIERGHLPGPDLPFLRTGDPGTIALPLDFLGVNYYSRVVLQAENGRPRPVPAAPREDLTDMGWEVYPRGLLDLLLRLHRDYRPAKVFITENGAAYADGPGPAGRIPDLRRIAYLRDHLGAAGRAIAEGVPLAGYFAWTLLDNFEWAHGYSKRFGLYWVDYGTQRRLPKDSAHWYRNVVAANAVDPVPLASP
jgi:beta-glucosidase